MKFRLLRGRRPGHHSYRRRLWHLFEVRFHKGMLSYSLYLLKLVTLQVIIFINKLLMESALWRSGRHHAAWLLLEILIWLLH